MSLDKIVKKIKEQAETEAKKILAEADTKEKEITDQSSAHLEKLEKQVQKEEAAIEIEVRNAIELPAKLSVRGETLNAKNELVDRAFKESIEFSDADYKKVLSYLFSQIPDISDGILLPAEGREKLTKDFLKGEKKNIKVGDPVKDIMGGFLLQAGKIEYDCSFVTLLKKLKEKLEPEIAPLFVK